MRKTISVLSLVSALLHGPMLSAQELTFGLGYADFHADTAESGPYFSAEYLGVRDWQFLGFDTGFGLAGHIHETGDAFLGGGLQAQRPFGRG